MKLRSKLIFGFVALSLILVIAGGVSIWELRKVGFTMQRVLDNNYRSISACKSMLYACELIDHGILGMYTSFPQNGRNDVFLGDSIFTAALIFNQSNISEPGEKEIIEKISVQFLAFRQLWDKTIVLTDSGAGLQFYLKEVYPDLQLLRSDINQLMTLNDNAMYENSKQLQQRVHRSFSPGIVAIIASLIFTFMWMYFLFVFFVNPLKRINKGIYEARKFGKPYTVHIDNKDELGDLNTMVDQILTK